MISDFFEIFLLSIIQGVSEFIPVSSAAHLILTSSIYEFKNQSLLIDISLHLGSLLAILFYFKDDIFNFNKNKNLFYKIIIGTLPLIIIGYFLYVTNIIDYFRNIKVIAWATLFFGILIYLKVPQKINNSLTDKINEIKKELNDSKKLKEEAKNLFADFENKIDKSKKETKEIIEKNRSRF